MSTATIFMYCERGRDASFWAEPLNAVSNAAFVMAGVACIYLIARSDPETRAAPGPATRAKLNEMWAETSFAALLITIGIGSFLFHTFATEWAIIADVAPIGLFMILYCGYALRRFLGWRPLLVVVALTGFAMTLRSAGSIPCSPDLLPITAAAGRPCLNGSLAYSPALVALLLLGLGLTAMRHAAGARVLTAALIFAVAFTARTLDFEWCAATRVLGAVRGTHVIWHILNAVVLYLLVSAAIIHGVRTRPPV